MKRFTLYTANESATAELVESDSGGWVRWEDAYLAVEQAYNRGVAEGRQKTAADEILQADLDRIISTMTEAQRWEHLRGSLLVKGTTQTRAVITAMELCDGLPLSTGLPEARRYRLRFPSVGKDEDGIYHLTWAFTDMPHQTFAIEVLPDGRLEWFFRDREKDVTLGSEDPVRRLPTEARKALLVFGLPRNR